MTPLTDRHMSAGRAATLLADILKWRLQIPTPQVGPRSVPVDRERVTEDHHDALPFGLDQVIDTTWSEGPTGTTTSQGVDKWLRFWLPWLEYWAGVQATSRLEPGAWWLHQLDENPALRTVSDWDEDDLAAWDEHTSELRTMWWQTAKLTGHAPLDRGLCPKCKQGTLRSPATKAGFQDEATCSNPKCELTVDYDPEEARASARAALRDPDTCYDQWLTIEEVRAVWPSISYNTIKSWVRRRQVRKRGGKYALDDINARRFRPQAGDPATLAPHTGR